MSLHDKRQQLSQCRRWVIKIGSSLLTNDGQGLDTPRIKDWVAQIAWLAGQGYELVLVSSGAIAAGVASLNWPARPEELSLLQAAAAVGQSRLVQQYELCFQRHGLHCAQVLLTHDDLAHRTRYLNARNTLKTLMRYQVVPVINENDTVAIDEIRFGDNDRLAALVANLIEADALLLLTDQAGLYTADPRLQPQAHLIDVIHSDDTQLLSMAGGGGALGRGGMLTKVQAARLAARSGALTCIAGGREPQVIQRISSGENLGTLLYTEQRPLIARKRWLAGHLQTRGQLIIDDGAQQALVHQGKSLLPVGVLAAHGRFVRGDAVTCLNCQGQEIARGLVNYSHEDAQRLCRKPSNQIRSILGYIHEPEMIHRDNLALLQGAS